MAGDLKTGLDQAVGFILGLAGTYPEAVAAHVAALEAVWADRQEILRELNLVEEKYRNATSRQENVLRHLDRLDHAVPGLFDANGFSLGWSPSAVIPTADVRRMLQ